MLTLNSIELGKLSINNQDMKDLEVSLYSIVFICRIPYHRNVVNVDQNDYKKVQDLRGEVKRLGTVFKKRSQNASEIYLSCGMTCADCISLNNG